MRARFLREVEGLGLLRGPPSAELITNDDLAPLPAPVQRYLRFMGVVGRPRHGSMRLGWSGGFRMKPDGPWLPCEAWQYNTRAPITRIFEMRLRFAKLFPVIARDTYVQGYGHLLAKLLDVFPLADADGEEIAMGELVTYLDDGIFLAPSMLLGPETTWTAASDASFDVTLRDRGHAVSARVLVDERGAPTDFSTTDRFYQPPEDPSHRWLRTRWTTPIDGWEMAEDRPVPTRGQAVWHLPEGPFAYVDFVIQPGSFAYDVEPGE
jgi:hypothetical protein